MKVIIMGVSSVIGLLLTAIQMFFNKIQLNLSFVVVCCMIANIWIAFLGGDIEDGGDE